MSEKVAYHHGNLRHTLVSKAVEIVANGGIEQLSLRALAREIGVSQAAPYRHFADKEALLAAIAAEGREKLATAMQQAMGDIPADPSGALRRGGRAYIEFASSNPETYRFMYQMKAKGLIEDKECAGDAFDLLRQTLEAGIAAGVFKPFDQQAALLACWSLVHGYAQLLIDGVVEPGEQTIVEQFQALGMVFNQGIFSGD